MMASIMGGSGSGNMTMAPMAAPPPSSKMVQHNALAGGDAGVAVPDPHQQMIVYTSHGEPIHLGPMLGVASAGGGDWVEGEQSEGWRQ